MYMRLKEEKKKANCIIVAIKVYTVTVASHVEYKNVEENYRFIVSMRLW